MRINKPCFFMICTDKTERECLEKNLFGGREWVFPYMKTIKRKDIGFLINVDKDELIGIFIADSEAQLDIEPNAWGGGFPAQIKVKLIGELQRINNATSKLENFLELKEIEKPTRSFFIPKMITYGPDITNKVLSLFKISPDVESQLQETEETIVSIGFTLDKVAGLNEIKQFIYERIIAPF